MTVHRVLAGLAITALSIFALSMPALSAQGDIRGAAEWDWLSGLLMVGCFALGAILGLSLSPALRTTAPDDYGRKKDGTDTGQMLKELNGSVRNIGFSVVELKESMRALTSQMQALQGDLSRRRDGDDTEQMLNQLSAAMRETAFTVAGLRDGMSALAAQVLALHSPSRSPEPPGPRPFESRDRPGREMVLLDHGKTPTHGGNVQAGAGSLMASVMEEYRQVMEDEEQSDGFLERWRVLRVTRTAAGVLEVVDVPTADFWALPAGAGGRALLLPSRRMLTRNFPALAANRGEGVRRDLGPLFEIEFAELEKPVVVTAARAMFDGQQIRVARLGHLRFPRQ
jgi:uncharacterized coiled-coil protein SlyX